MVEGSERGAMRDRRLAWPLFLAGTLGTIWLPRASVAQAPTIEETGIVGGATSATRPGSMIHCWGRCRGRAA